MAATPTRIPCPHCKEGSLSPTKEKKSDTSKVIVRVFKCAACGYTEGRPVKVAE